MSLPMPLPPPAPAPIWKRLWFWVLVVMVVGAWAGAVNIRMSSVEGAPADCLRPARRWLATLQSAFKREYRSATITSSAYVHADTSEGMAYFVAVTVEGCWRSRKVQRADHEKCRARSDHRRPLLPVQLSLVAAHPVALALDVHDGRVVQQPVQDRRGHDLVGEDSSPVREPSVGRQHDRSSLVAAGDHLEDPVGGGLIHRQVAELVDDQHARTGERPHLRA